MGQVGGQTVFYPSVWGKLAGRMDSFRKRFPLPNSPRTIDPCRKSGLAGRASVLEDPGPCSQWRLLTLHKSVRMDDRILRPIEINFRNIEQGSISRSKASCARIWCMCNRDAEKAVGVN